MLMCLLFTMLFASFRCCFLGLVPVTSCCEDSFDYVHLSSSWTRSSSLRDLRQDGHTLEITSILACLVVRSIAMPRYLPLAISCLPYCHVKPLTHLVLTNRCLAMLPLCSAPLIALLVAGEDEGCSMLDYVDVGISQYLLFNSLPFKYTTILNVG